MADHVCPWWMGYVLANPLRRLIHDPQTILGPFVEPGMTVLEIGPGMGFFTLPLARRVGPSGRVVAVDVQEKMLAVLRRRAAKAALLERLDLRLAPGAGMGVSDLAGKVDFVLAFAVVHELPDQGRFFREAAESLKEKGKLLLVEPSGRIDAQRFAATIQKAEGAGLRNLGKPPAGRSSFAAVLALPLPAHPTKG
jgi:ubiquinone/menaquinone biosynthesis C-methylase UbiE